MSLPIRTFLMIAALVIFYGSAAAQPPEAKVLKVNETDHDDEERPKNIQESLEKMRIEKDKKDHQEMVDRGEEAVKLTAEVQRSFVETGKLSSDDVAKLTRVEKIVKKVRDELGGDDDDSQDTDDDVRPASNALGDVLDLLKTRADILYDELKKTTRFTISAAAISSSNAVLKLARILRFGH